MCLYKCAQSLWRPERALDHLEQELLLDMIVGNQTGVLCKQSAYSITLTLCAGHCCRLCFNDKENEAAGEGG